jgi:hypothetical protein
VVFNVFNNKNVGAIIIYVEKWIAQKWFAPRKTLYFIKFESEFFGDCETI